jgi:hypothetical protein
VPEKMEVATEEAETVVATTEELKGVAMMVAAAAGAVAMARAAARREVDAAHNLMHRPCDGPRCP